MYVILAKRFGRCDTELFMDPDWDQMKRKIVDTYGPELENDFNRHNAWAALRRGHTVICAGEMFSMRNTDDEDAKETTFFVNETILDVNEIHSEF